MEQLKVEALAKKAVENPKVLYVKRTYMVDLGKVLIETTINYN